MNDTALLAYPALPEREVHRATKLRLYPTPEQTKALEAQCHANRALWNALHEWWIGHPKTKRATYSEADKAIRQARKEIPYLALVPAQAAQSTLRTYFQAWQNCWDGRARAPKYKERAKTRLAIDLPQGSHLNPQQISNKYGTIYAMRIGHIKVRNHAEYPERITGARIVKESDGHWYISLRGTYTLPETEERELSVVGVDRGIAIPVATSNGEHYHHAPYLTESEKRHLKRLYQHKKRQEKAARADAKKAKQKGEEKPRRSKRLQATYDAIAKVESHQVRRRRDFQHKVSQQLANDYSVVVLEDLNIKGMSKKPAPKPDPENPGRFLPNGRNRKRGLNKAILNEGWYNLEALLSYKVNDLGGEVISVPAHYSSLDCHKCDNRDVRQRDNQALFECLNPLCGWSGNADDNAALVVKKRGLLVLSERYNRLEESVLDVESSERSSRVRKGTLEENCLDGAVKRQTLVVDNEASNAS